ncbi:MAG: mechanosensitive ion channel [Candidatus Auribacterota bacterium]|jgi:small conductance mechanosensitive channel|nr:mechanosensitive ion channel [Candidatus Auribacterota bacterium]
MDETLAKLYDVCVLYGLRVIYALIIFIIGKWASRIISKAVSKVMKKAHVDDLLCSFTQHLTYFTILVFVIIAALNKLGVQTTSFVAVIGAAGLAIGFALQGSLSNFAAGVMLVLFKPFKVGDFIEAASATGVVEEIQIFNTILRSPDNKIIIMPNAKITGDKIINYTGIDKRRIDLVFSISYSDNIKTAKEALEKLLSDNAKILKDPKPLIAVSELGESSVNLVCRPWVKPADYWDVYFDLLEKGKISLEKQGITIPFPQRDVHLYQKK